MTVTTKTLLGRPRKLSQATLSEDRMPISFDPTPLPSRFELHATPVAPHGFTLGADGTIEESGSSGAHGGDQLENGGLPQLLYSSEGPPVRVYRGNSLELLDAVAARHPEGMFDMIFADPPYFLSNGGITCHAGKMVRVDKGDWDKSRGPELNHEFNLEWLRRCQRVLKPNGTIWVSGTHHVIFSIGYALQQLGYKILNDIAWEKRNPPPNLSCRYFTHSTETVLWAAKNEKSRHVFNYQEMRRITGKQMKTVWRKDEFPVDQLDPGVTTDELDPTNIWTMNAPSGNEKAFGRHPTQKPVGLVERCIVASTRPGDMVLDPFLGGGTTGVACARLERGCVGIELDENHAKLAVQRIRAAAERDLLS